MCVIIYVRERVHTCGGVSECVRVVRMSACSYAHVYSAHVYKFQLPVRGCERTCVFLLS